MSAQAPAREVWSVLSVPSLGGGDTAKAAQPKCPPRTLLARVLLLAPECRAFAVCVCVGVCRYVCTRVCVCACVDVCARVCVRARGHSRGSKRASFSSRARETVSTAPCVLHVYFFSLCCLQVTLGRGLPGVVLALGASLPLIP